MISPARGRSKLQPGHPSPSSWLPIRSRSRPWTATGPYASLPDAQWSDALPKLLQLKLLRGLEDAGGFAGVSRPLEGVTGDLQLVLDLRKFQIAPDLVAEIEIGSKLLGSNGRIVATRTFRASVPVEGRGAPAAVAALNKAFDQVGGDL